MAYCTAAQVKTYLGIASTGDDALIGDLISRAQKIIDQHTGRRFESTAATLRTFDVSLDTSNRTLYLDDDLAAITLVVTNADASTGTTVASTDYVTEPRRAGPYHALTLLSSSTKDWEYTNDPEKGVTVTGHWAYSTAAGDDIVQACIRLASYLYRQADAQVFDVTAIPETGVITIPQGIPADVKMILAPYKKRFWGHVH